MVGKGKKEFWFFVCVWIVLLISYEYWRKGVFGDNNDEFSFKFNVRCL